MIEIPIIDAPKQTFTLTLNEKQVRMEVKYNTIADRWTFDLWVDDVLKLSGRKIVTGCNLVYPFTGLGVGVIWAAAISDPEVEPNRENLPLGNVKLFQATEEELLEVLNA